MLFTGKYRTLGAILAYRNYRPIIIESEIESSHGAGGDQNENQIYTFAHVIKTDQTRIRCAMFRQIIIGTRRYVVKFADLTVSSVVRVKTIAPLRKYCRGINDAGSLGAFTNHLRLSIAPSRVKTLVLFTGYRQSKILSTMHI